MIKANLGCGNVFKEGYINVDHPRTIIKKDVEWDLEKLPWPFKDNYFDEVLMWNSLEHLSKSDEKIEEVFRILKPGGYFIGSVPYAFCDGAVQNPEHRSFFTEKSFNFFCKDKTNKNYLDYRRYPLFYKKSVKLICLSNTPKTFLRTLIFFPFRQFLRYWIRNMYDEIHFTLIKL